MKRLLFVCTGNVCRSPMAEGICRTLLEGTGDFEVASAGVHAGLGFPPSEEAVEALREVGIDISHYRSQPISDELVESSDYIFAMTREHRRLIELLYPSVADRLFLLREFEGSTADVPDPIGQGQEVYLACRDTIRNAIDHIVQHLTSAQNPISMSNTRTSHQPNVQSASALRKTDPEIFAAIAAEEKRQAENIELIASENFTSRAVMEAQGSCLTNKYAEGYPGKRWYGGCENADVVEQLAIDRAKQLFGADHANVQPHSGSQANMAVYFSVLTPGDRILTMDLAHGGHLTHGHKANFSGKLYEVAHYGVDEKDERINYDGLAKAAEEFRPKMITAGASAYPRAIDFERMSAIAESVGAYLLIDMAHIAGLVAGGAHASPVPHAHFVTTTTHKSLRGPRSGLILCREEFARKVDSLTFPGIQGGPLMHVIAAKAVCFHEALQPEFRDYARQIVSNAKALAAQLSRLGYRIVSGGTDNHVMLVDIRPKGLNGAQVQKLLDEVCITVNKNAIPFDTESILKTGGIRIGTPAMTTRGMKEEEMMEIADLIHAAIEARENPEQLARIRGRVVEFTAKFPLP